MKRPPRPDDARMCFTGIAVIVASMVATGVVAQRVDRQEREGGKGR